MITEDYCSFELSKLLKEKGFDEECDWFYEEVGDLNRRTRNGCDKYINSLLDYGEYAAPTHQMAMKWLREEKGIYVYVEPYLLGGTYIDELEVHYCGQILDSNRRRLHSIANRTSYTEAIEERIKYALKSLI